MRGFVEKETMLEVLLVIIVVSFAALLVLRMAQEGNGEGAMTREECENRGGQVCDCLPESRIGVVHEGVRILPCCKKEECT